jgi:hypothetical protein
MCTHNIIALSRGSIWELGFTNVEKLSRLDRRDGVADGRGVAAEILDLGASDREHDDTQRKAAEVLLMREVPIAGKEDVVLGGSKPEERPVLDAVPPSVGNGMHDESGQLFAQHAR